MALGSAVSGLLKASQTKGWDPTKIQGGGDISGFNVVPQPWEQRTTVVGQLPEGIHDSYPEDHPAVTQGKETFNHPDASREGGQEGRSPRATTGADPFPGGRIGG